MAITVNGAILRNMPEQISKNVDDIADLQTTSENYETRITALENSTILAATFQDCTFTGTTEVQGDLNQTSGDLAVTNNATIGGTLGVTGTVTASNDLDVGGDLSVGVDASVAGDLAVTGAITGGSIIENMSGYSFTKGASSNVTYNYYYAGVVKNGNKVTFTIFVSVVRTNTADSIALGTFGIPSSLGALLYPYDGTKLDRKKTYFSATYNTGIDCPIQINKNSNLAVEFNAYDTGNLTLNTTYVARVEVTFLLSDNLAV